MGEAMNRLRLTTFTATARRWDPSLLLLPLLPIALMQHGIPAYLSWRKTRNKRAEDAVAAALMRALLVFPPFWLAEVIVVAFVSISAAIVFACVLPLSLASLRPSLRVSIAWRHRRPGTTRSAADGA
jgi:hypothetical protein